MFIMWEEVIVGIGLLIKSKLIIKADIRAEQSSHVEMVVLLIRIGNRKSDTHVKISVEMEELQKVKTVKM